MAGLDRKAAVAAYKERKTVAGVYAVRCAASGQAWVGQAANIDTIWNRIGFALRLGSSTSASLQDACAIHGAASITFEILERVDEDLPLRRSSVLKDRKAYWRDRLSAETL